jgi:cytidine deaminase
MSEYKNLIKAAKEPLKRAYAPYSGFKVGAAVLTKTGRVFAGCNIENASYGLTVCAERAAVFNAVSAGHRNFTAIAVVTSGKSIAFPCGACLQVLSEFAPDIKIILASSAGRKVVTKRLKELLPTPFSL